MIFSKKNVKVFVTNISKHQKIIFLYFYAGIAFLGIAGKRKVIKEKQEYFEMIQIFIVECQVL